MDSRKIIDLRSDTVTSPTTEMRQAMAEAAVGDDVFGEDPTVNRLQELAAKRMGKEAGLFLTSGTMGNLIGVLSHCQRGDEVLVGAESHIFWYEVAGTAAVGGVQLRTIPDEDGAPTPTEVEQAIRTPNVHFPRTAVVAIENTHNRRGGVVVRPPRMREIATVAHLHDLRVHLDGARIFNASIALGISARELAVDADSVTFCLSKGLGAPVGSLLCGSRAYIDRARKLRKMLGGGMRQAGVLAAAGLVAVEQMVDRLADDHANALVLAGALGRVPGLHVDTERAQTNIVVAEVASSLPANKLIECLADRGVKCTSMGGQTIRFVTHLGIERADIEAAAATIQTAVAEMADRGH